MRPEFVTALIELLNRIEINTPRSVGESADESERIYVDASQGRWGLAWWEAGNLRDRSGIFPSWLKEKPIAYKELYAAEMGLRECKERKLKNVTIISDNKNVVSWMSRWCAGPPLIMSWLQRLRNDYYYIYIYSREGLQNMINSVSREAEKANLRLAVGQSKTAWMSFGKVARSENDPVRKRKRKSYWIVCCFCAVVSINQ